MKKNSWNIDLSKIIFNVLDIESEAILNLKKNISLETWHGILATILNSKGRVIVTGMGKSGIIGKKISSTLSSTGTQSFFIHPAEAWHGDLGMINQEDVVILISYSGETNEVLNLISFLKENKNKTVAITGNLHSTLARNTDFIIDIHVSREACPLQLAPTSSTTATLAIGDTLAILLMQARDFKPEHFARFHPGGILGRRLLTRVEDVMRKTDLPVLSLQSSVKELIPLISQGRLGLVIIITGKKIEGIVTDGDLRRAIEKFGSALFEKKITTFMTKHPKCIETGTKLTDAEQLMTKYKITSLLVTRKGHLEGVIQIYDL